MTYQDMHVVGCTSPVGGDGDRLTALIIDDCVATGQLLERMLRETPVDVLGCVDGVEQAGRLVGRLHPDIIFVDMLVLGRRADDALAHLRRLDPHIKMVLSTTHARRCAPGGRYLPKADQYLLRPYHRNRVAERVRELCQLPPSPVSCG